MWVGLIQLKALRKKTEEEAIMSQDCNTEMLPEFLAYWPAHFVDFEFKTTNIYLNNIYLNKYPAFQSAL